MNKKNNKMITLYICMYFVLCTSKHGEIHHIFLALSRQGGVKTGLLSVSWEQLLKTDSNSLERKFWIQENGGSLP